ncbi:MAG: hypothetical protein ACI9KE_005841, partial [Polyangiales bacterium]
MAQAALVSVEDLEARLDLLWGDADSLRLQSWLRRTWLRLSRRGDEVLSAAIEGFAKLEDEDTDWKRHRAAIVAELAANVAWLEDRARTVDEIDGTVLSWLHDVVVWIRAMDHLVRRPVFASRYSLMRGLGSRALRNPGSALPAHIVMSVDSICREAAEESELLSRREALLRAAQRILLNAAALVDAPMLGQRYEGVCEELRQLRRMARVADPAVSIDFQIRAAAKRGDGRVLPALSAVRAYMRAEGENDGEAMKWAAKLAEAKEAVELPARVTAAIEEGFELGRLRLNETIDRAPPLQRFRLQGHASELKSSAEESFLRMAIDSNTAFDVGISLQQEQHEQVQELREAVSFPTATLAVSPVGDVSGITQALIEDPRLLLYHFASRRLLQRRFIRSRTRRRRGGTVRASVRFYLLDGSSSMRGPRGRMRDALFVAELASLVERLEDPGGRIRSLLFYRYFASSAEVTRRVATAEEALSTIRSVFGTQRAGGTDIQSALLESLALIEEQRDNDVELSRAQIVLVTDGQADVDPDMLRQAQERLAVPVRVSIIALGAESSALRRFAAEQRHAGLEVIYQHVGDEALFERDTKKRAPRPDFSVPTQASILAYEAPSDEGDDLEHIVASLEELGLDEDALTPSRRRTLNIQRAGRAALSRRFDALFPSLKAGREVVAFDAAATELLHLLMVVAEVLHCTPSAGWQVQSDAVAIMERLLREHGVSKAAYMEALRTH